MREALRWLPDQPGEIEAPPDEWPVNAPAPGGSDQFDNRLSVQDYILIADDNADMREYLQRLLVGYVIKPVTDGRPTRLPSLQRAAAFWSSTTIRMEPIAWP